MSLRIAVISTPRSGNTWLRLLLMDAYAIPGFAVHRPDDVDWAGLPEEIVLQVHWHRTPALVHRLREEGFRIVSVTRHPLDVLISILQFCLHDDSTLQWLDGEGGNERSIHGAMPGSAAFLEYGVGPRAAALMAVSREWASAPECLRVRYEDLVADGEGELKRITEALGETTRQPIVEAVANATVSKLRNRHAAHHFWQGRPDLWRFLLLSPAVERLVEANHAYCEELGYSCAADPLLLAVQADANWLELIWPQVGEKLRAYRTNKQGLAQGQDEIRRLEGEYAAAVRSIEELATRNEKLARDNAELARDIGQLARDNAELIRGNEKLAASCQELQNQSVRAERAYKELQIAWQAAQKEQVEAMQALQNRLRGLGPTSLAMARRLADLSHRMPGAASAVKRLLQLKNLKTRRLREGTG